MQSKTPQRLLNEEISTGTKRLLVDFDRVIHLYSKGWQDGSIYDKPVPGAIKALKSLIKAGFEIIVFTTESSMGKQRHQEIKKWLKKKGLNIQVTSTKLPAIAIIDDRAIRFTNWIDILHYFI